MQINRTARLCRYSSGGYRDVHAQCSAQQPQPATSARRTRFDLPLSRTAMSFVTFYKNNDSASKSHAG